MNKNDISLYNILVESDNYLTTKEISQKIGCSEKTVRNSLDRIEKELDNLKIKYEMTRKQSKGIKLEVEEDYDINETRDFLILDLLKNNRNYLQDLKDKYYLSYNEIRRQIVLISYKLKSYGIEIEIKQKQGILLKANEENINNYLKTFLEERIDNDIDKFINYYYDTTKIKITDRIIQEFQIEEKIILKEYARNYLRILILNATNDNNLKKLNIKTNCWVESIREKVKLYLNIEMTNKDIYQIKNFIKSKDFIQNIEFKELKDSKIYELIENIDNHFKQIGEEFIYDNKDLIYNLKDHIKLTLYKIKNKENIRNPICNEIKEEYPYYFNEVFKVVEEFNKGNKNIITIDEIPYIVIYIITIEKSTHHRRTKAIVVCNYGAGISKYLIEILKNNLEWIDFEKSISIEEIDSMNLEDYLIFSTMNLEGYDYIKIPANISENYIKNLKTDMIKKNSNYLKLFSKNLFKEKATIYSKKEAIDLIVKNSNDLNLVTKDYIDTVKYREKLDSTEIGKQMVLLHGDDSFVKKSHISFYKLEKPIQWQEDKVKYIFLIAVKKTEYEKYDMRDFFRQIIKLKDNMDLLEKVKTLNDLKDALTN